MSEAWQVVLGCDLPICTQACSRQVLGVCCGAGWCLLAVSSWLRLAQRRGRMDAERLAFFFGKTAILDCSSQIDHSEKHGASLCWVALSPDERADRACLPAAGCRWDPVPAPAAVVWLVSRFVFTVVPSPAAVPGGS